MKVIEIRCDSGEVLTTLRCDSHAAGRSVGDRVALMDPDEEGEVISIVTPQTAPGAHLSCFLCDIRERMKAAP